MDYGGQKMKRIKNLNNGANIFVAMGRPGTGKTHLTLSHPGKKILFSFDKSYSSLDNTVDVYEPEITDFQNVDKLIQEIDELTKGYDLVVFDSISSLELEYVAANVSGKIGNNTNKMAAYGSWQEAMMKFRIWALDFPGDVMFTLWTKFVDDKEVADMNDKAYNSVAGYAKMVSRTVNGFEGYLVVVNPDGKGEIKNRLGDKITKKEIANDDYWTAIDYARKAE